MKYFTDSIPGTSLAAIKTLTVGKRRQPCMCRRAPQIICFQGRGGMDYS